MTWRYPYSTHLRLRCNIRLRQRFFFTNKQTPVCAQPDLFWENAKLFSAAWIIFKPKEKCGDNWSLNSMESITVLNSWEHPEEPFIFFYWNGKLDRRFDFDQWETKQVNASTKLLFFASTIEYALSIFTQWKNNFHQIGYHFWPSKMADKSLYFASWVDKIF